jgi:hypothetical protein
MEIYSVYLTQLPEVFKKIQTAKIPIKIYNHSSQWSGHFFQVLEIKAIKDKGYEVTVLILFDPDTSNAIAIDLKSVNMIELNSPLEFEGRAIKNINVKKNDTKKAVTNGS